MTTDCSFQRCTSRHTSPSGNDCIPSRQLRSRTAQSLIIADADRPRHQRGVPLSVGLPAAAALCDSARMSDDPGWTATAVDDVEAVPWRGTELMWRPVRQALGTRLVGIAAFTAERVGQEVIEGHRESEDGRGHEEIYIVLRGRATFCLGDASLDAPPGTLVCVRDPQLFRQAVAAESGTAVLALGGDPHFVPSASEWIERARPLLHSNRTQAAAILDALHAEQPNTTGDLIGRALLAAADGDTTTASAVLRAVLCDSPDLRDSIAAEPTLAQLVPPLPPIDNGLDQGSNAPTR
jgi:mannose-6-phosphate isomerase-like protein (cupin superfamily)